MSTPASEDPSEFERVDVFISHTGKVHYVKKHPWGIGAACTDRYLIGDPATEIRQQVDCGRCRSL